MTRPSASSIRNTSRIGERLTPKLAPTSSSRMRLPGANSRKTIRSDSTRAISVAITDGRMKPFPALQGGGGSAAILSEDIATIGDDGFTGAVGRCIGDEEHSELGDLPGRAPASQRNPGHAAVAPLRILTLGAHTTR